MKFTLTYDGPLPATGNKKKPKELWAIRRVVHTQISDLFCRHPVLDSVSGNAAINGNDDPFEPINIGQRSFVPLVRKSLSLICSIDIAFLRNEEPGNLITQSGDIDNRLKTLFDALRMPQEIGEIDDNTDIVQPLYCLLENDSLITNFSVNTDRLLGSAYAPANAVKLMMVVRVNATAVTWGNISLLGD